ncbi:MAG: glycosidase, partial [Phycisphaerae bacterium]
MPSKSDDPRARLLNRHPDNPLLTSYDWPYFVNTVFNAGAAKLPSGETLLLCRVEDCTGKSHLCAARSDNGVNGWRIDPRPTLLPDAKNHPEEIWGIEDPRVIWMPELERFAVCYTCYARRGPGVSLALTKDFVTFERIGNVMPAENKDATLLPRRLNGRWAMIHRPVPRSGEAHIWISFSPDLIHWGHHTLLMEARRGSWWDANKIGLSPPLIETEDGWLMIYHGSKQTPAGCLYRIGLALLDLED